MLDPLQTQSGDDRQADRSTAEHDGRGARLDARLVDGVQPDGHRLGEGGVPGVEAVRDLERQHVRQDDLLGVAARIEVREAHRVHSFGVEHHRHRHHEVTLGAVADVVAQGDHLGRELMAHHHVMVEVHHPGDHQAVRHGT